MGPSSPLSPFPGGPWSPLSPWTHRRNQVIAVLLQNVWNKCVRTRNKGSVSLQTSGKHFTPPGLKAVLTWRTSATRLMRSAYSTDLHSEMYIFMLTQHDLLPDRFWPSTRLKCTKPSAAADVCVRKFSIYRNKQILSRDAWVCIDWRRGVTVGGQ